MNHGILPRLADSPGLDAARQVARDYAGEVRRHFGDRVAGIWLYGSAARGDWGEESDIDVLVLLDRIDSADSEWLVSRAVHLGVLGSGMLLQPVFMAAKTYSQLKARERLFAIEVERDGVDL